jgi:D-alanyl-D-alanine carboxypeptidase (penicillin-binding protein 5/6)
MRKKLFSILAITMTLVLSFQPNPVMAAQTEDSYEEDWDYDEEEYTYPDSYYWPAQTDSIPGWPSAPAIEAQAAVLMDARTGNLLYAKNKDDKHYPASITKIMTTLLALENCSLKDTVEFSRQAVTPTEDNSSTIGIQEGETLRMSQSLFAVMLASANEVAYGVGEHTCGNLKKFVELMNQRAKELGCTHTHFNNASGLPDERHYTTAYDMALISKAAWKNRYFRKIAGTKEYVIKKTNKTTVPIEMYNHHKMLTDYEYLYKGCVGGKTGYTSQAGNTLVTYARRGSVTLIAVVLMDSYPTVYDDTKAILDYGFDNFHRLSLDTDKVQTIQPKLLPASLYCLPNHGEIIFARCHENGYAVVPKGVEEKDLVAKHTMIPNALGNWRIRTDYFYNNWKVGSSYSYLENSLKTLCSSSKS